jgi:cysteinyl-tRNA synthetase
VRNITDVDDKINAAAKEQGVSIQHLTGKITEFFYQDIGALNVLRPTVEPKATTHIAEMIIMIDKLLKQGNAYEKAGHVLFDVTSFPDYGKLANRQLDEMIAGSRIDIAAYKKNPLDFVLWKPVDKDDDASSIFESPWGQGRPGWHIECSAMSSKYLGADFDIHGGGADLQFPHHENEIAQSRCANGGTHYARFWIHNGFLTVNGEKMSKSMKNFFTVRDLLDKGVPGVAIRYMLLSSHYRKPLDFTLKAMEEAQRTMEKFYSVFEKSDLAQKLENKPSKQVLEFLSDDLNISKVTAFLHEMVKEVKATNSPELKNEFLANLDFLGFFDASFLDEKKSTNEIDESYINSKIELRAKAKAEKNFARADEIRNELLAQGIVIEDKKEGVTWKRSN